MFEQHQGSGESQTVSTGADHITCPEGLPKNPPSSDISGMPKKYLTTPEAAGYLRKSQSWLLRQGDIAYKTGRPNTYDIVDLDAWFERHKHIPLT